MMKYQCNICWERRGLGNLNGKSAPDMMELFIIPILFSAPVMLAFLLPPSPSWFLIIWRWWGCTGGCRGRCSLRVVHLSDLPLQPLWCSAASCSCCCWLWPHMHAAGAAAAWSRMKQGFGSPREEEEEEEEGARGGCLQCKALLFNLVAQSRGCLNLVGLRWTEQIGAGFLEDLYRRREIFWT